MGNQQGGHVSAGRPRLDFRSLQARHGAWADRNFGADTSDLAVMHTVAGITEELGELSHALLKQQQGIRGKFDEHEAAGKDAVGDMLLYLTHLCNRKGWDLQAIVEDTAAQVWSRDWVSHPETGLPLPVDNEGGGS